MAHDTAKPLLIAALGTSLTANGHWVEKLPAALEPALSREISTMNFGRPGASSRYGVAVSAHIATLRPDIVTVEFATNDSALHRGVELAESQANLTAIISLLRAANRTGRIYLMTMSPAYGLRGLIRPRLNRYYETYPGLAARAGTGFIDSRPAWAGMSRAQISQALPDGLHPTQQSVLRYTLPLIVETLMGDLRGHEC